LAYAGIKTKIKRASELPFETTFLPQIAFISEFAFLDVKCRQQKTGLSAG
jgi:hypothetical protein